MIRRLQQSGKILFSIPFCLICTYILFPELLWTQKTSVLVMNSVVLKRSGLVIFIPPTHPISFKRHKLFVMFQFVEEEGWLPAQDDVNVITLHGSPPVFLHLPNSSPIINPLSWTRVRLVYHPEQNILEQGGHKSYLSYRLTQSLLSGLFDWDEFY